MQTATQAVPVTTKLVWAGRIVSALCVLFLLLDGVMKLVNPAFVVEASARLGYAEGLAPWLGVLLLVCTAAYMIPRTAILGAVLLTGYLGGAVASHLRIGDNLFPVLFPVFFGALIWGGLVLRDARLRTFLPLRS